MKSFSKKFKLGGRTLCWDQNIFARKSIGNNPGEKMLRMEHEVFTEMESAGLVVEVRNGDVYEIRPM